MSTLDLSLILHFLFEQVAVGQQLESAQQRHRATQLVEQFERVGNVRLCLALEKALVPALAETGGRVHSSERDFTGSAVLAPCAMPSKSWLAMQ